MRPAKAWLVAAKDFKIFAKKRSIFNTIVWFELVISIVLPIILRYVSSKHPDPATFVPPLINAFSFLFVIGAAVLPISTASYSLVGEKIEHSLEPLLAAPITDGEILTGKSLAAALPAIGATWAGGVVFMVLVDVLTRSALKSLYYPNWTIAVILLVLAPLTVICSVAANVLISSRSNDVRAAQQLGYLTVLPFAAIYLFSELRVLTLSVTNLLIIAAVLLVVGALTLSAAVRIFNRDAILTAWK